ncbi:MAG: hypothetical protein HOW97_42225 [Catenulispora sp.]|nr:hypothetical protein [Catenulispora sp.]
MNTHARSTPAARPTTSWILVAAIIAGALVLGGAVIAGSITLLVIGAVVVLAALGCAAVLTHRGAAPFSFTEEFPEHTFGPRATEHGDSSPPIDTEPHRPPGPAHYHIVEEFDAEAMSDPPDDQRVFPQYVNLDPDERLRNVAGREVIERAEPHGEPGDTERGDADDGRHPADRQ